MMATQGLKGLQDNSGNGHHDATSVICGSCIRAGFNPLFIEWVTHQNFVVSLAIAEVFGKDRLASRSLCS